MEQFGEVAGLPRSKTSLARILILGAIRSGANWLAANRCAVITDDRPRLRYSASAAGIHASRDTRLARQHHRDEIEFSFLKSNLMGHGGPTAYLQLERG
jgi:hypothetical protein